MLESVHLELIGLRQPRFGQPLADVLALIPLELQHLAVLGVFDYSSIARKFLKIHN